MQGIFFSSNGYYFGKLESTSNANVFRLKHQIHMSEKMEFCLGISRKIVEAKIHNQMILLKRYNRRSEVDLHKELVAMQVVAQSAMNSNTVEQLMGHEGNASRNYFQGLTKLINPEFLFNGRNRMPPRDPFNAMISFGYTVLMNEIYGEIENHGLTPYAGFMHKDKERHPTLASDLLEEWRAVIVDATVFRLIQGHELSIDDFEKRGDDGGIVLKREAKRVFLRNLESKMKSEMNYLSYVEEKTSFRKAIWLQIRELVHAIENNDYNRYEPIRIR